MRNVLIIGAGRGIGLSLTKRMINDHRVLAVTRSPSEELTATGAMVQYGDVAGDFMPALPEAFQQLDALVYCPGSIQLKPFTRLSSDDFLQDFTQNVLGAVKVIQYCIPYLKRSGNASVVLFSTVAVKTGMSFHSSIAVSKAGIEGLVRSLAAEYAGANIRFNALAPSLIETPLSAQLINTPEKREAAAKKHPLQRIGHADEVAALAAFLLGAEAGWITGQVIGIDGGLGNTK